MERGDRAGFRIGGGGSARKWAGASLSGTGLAAALWSTPRRAREVEVAQRVSWIEGRVVPGVRKAVARPIFNLGPTRTSTQEDGKDPARPLHSIPQYLAPQESRTAFRRHSVG